MASSQNIKLPSSPPYPEVDDTLDWRVKDENEEQPCRKVLSHGISPKTFYANNQNHRRRPRFATALQASIQDSYVKYQKSRLCQELEVKRSAFRQVSCLQTHPLQELALAHHRELLSVHLRPHSLCSGPSLLEGAKSAASLLEDTQTSSGASAASSSGLSLDTDVERKRPVRDAMLSPGKSRHKAAYVREFLAEQRLERPLPVQHVFGPALWSMEPRVWSVEKKGGKRKYLTAHFGRFADLYWRKQEPTCRHYYEVILENTPCRLYMDLEFAKDDADRTDNAERLLDELFAELQIEFESVFPQVGLLQRSQVVDLDSSTTTKFSRHWIVHTSHLFAHTTAVGLFVVNWMGRLSNEHATEHLAAKGRHTLQAHLFYNDGKDCVLDMGVYTRNRLFRLLGSRKHGKPEEATLRVASANEFPLGLPNHLFYPPCMAKPLPSTSAEDVDAKVEHFVHATDWSQHSQALADTLVIPLNASKLDYPILPFDTAITAATQTQQKRAIPSFQPSNASHGSSPYPSLENFVVNVLGQRGCEDGSALQGRIRAWSVDRHPTNNSVVGVTFQMCRNRWCEHIQRSHKSNNIYWMVDLTTYACIQACHDPDCRTFRSQPVRLPESLQHELSETLFEEALATLNLEESSEKDEHSTEPENFTDDALLEAVSSNPELFP